MLWRSEEGKERLVLGFSSDLSIVAALLLRPDEVVIAAGVGLVSIRDFRDVSYSISAHLQHRNAHGHVVCSLEVPSAHVLQILLLDLQK